MDEEYKEYVNVTADEAEEAVEGVVWSTRRDVENLHRNGSWIMQIWR